ncbi:hypothetical protein [Pseudorhodoplanes sp.]|uniref:hypothetical protein n=1 Tax=Pseudorhodoplanes sp. TaxID=1934341 RepID=UPI003D0C392D
MLIIAGRDPPLLPITAEAKILLSKLSVIAAVSWCLGFFDSHTPRHYLSEITIQASHMMEPNPNLAFITQNVETDIGRGALKNQQSLSVALIVALYFRR